MTLQETLRKTQASPVWAWLALLAEALWQCFSSFADQCSGVWRVIIYLKINPRRISRFLYDTKSTESYIEDFTDLNNSQRKTNTTIKPRMEPQENLTGGCGLCVLCRPRLWCETQSQYMLLKDVWIPKMHQKDSQDGFGFNCNLTMQSVCGECYLTVM